MDWINEAHLSDWVDMSPLISGHIYDFVYRSDSPPYNVVPQGQPGQDVGQYEGARCDSFVPYESLADSGALLRYALPAAALLGKQTAYHRCQLDSESTKMCVPRCVPVTQFPRFATMSTPQAAPAGILAAWAACQRDVPL
jgi:hypothetical protein